MKRNRICYLLLIIAMLATFNVYAATGQIGGLSKIDGKPGSTSRYNTPNGIFNYEYYQQIFKPDVGEDMTMYCTYPRKGSQSNHRMTCELATPDKFPKSYQLLVYVQKNNITNEWVLDLAFRLAGVYDRVQNGTLTVTRNSDYQVKAFYNTYVTKVLGQTTEFSDFILFGDDVDKAVVILKESLNEDISGLTPGSGDDNNQGIFTLELVSEGDNYKIYNIKANRTVQNPSITTTGVHYEWVDGHKWNGTTGQIKVSSLSTSSCKGSITVSATVDIGKSSAIYSCRYGESTWQHFIAIGPSRTGDTFNVSTCPEPDCMKEGCGEVIVSSEVKEKDIHNCCEEGAVTKVRQAALDELFCKDGTLNVEYYKEKCNAETYIEDTSKYCKLYCGSTGMYQLPGPTHGKANQYFRFDTSVTGFAGPLLNQYKRCRTIIYFDKWLEDYNNNNKLMTDSLNDYNKYLALYNQMNNTSSQDHTETFTITCPSTNGGSPVVRTDSINMKKYVVSGVTYNTFKTSMDASYKKIVIENGPTANAAGGTYYSKDSIQSAKDKYNSLVNNNPGCTVSNNSFAEYESTKDEYYKNANSALNNYNAFASESDNLRNGLTTCSGKADANGTVDTSSIRSKIKFNKEPEMEFSYNQVYLNDAGKLVNQEVKIDFEKVGGNCVYQVYDTLDKPNKNSKDWNENWDIIGIYDDRYSGKFGTGVLAVDTVKNNVSFGNAVTNVDSIRSDKFYASKKFTTDAVGHMTCKWEDSKKNKSYTLIPVGIVSREEITGKLSDLNPKYTSRTGIYNIVKTHAKGKFETYFTLKNLADGLFDDIIHDGGQTCSEKYGEIYGGEDSEKQEGVNATCYIEIENVGFNIYDCTQTDVIASNDKFAELCCEQGSCIGNGVIDYKEVDPANMFPNDYNDNYAYNWLKTDDGHAAEVLKHIKDSADADKTYSPGELTYSFTLTPKDLREIRAYNKAMVDQGGYTNFDMDCDTEEYDDHMVYVRCRSRFLTAISGGSLNYNGGTLKLKTNNIDLLKSRSIENWK